MTIERPHLEYNLAGGLLLTLTEEKIWRLCQGVKEAGYTHACILPFRGLTPEKAGKSLRNQPLTIIHFEDAWNPTSFDSFPIAILAGLLGYARRFAGDKTQPPILQDAAFPSKITCQRLVEELMKEFPEAKFISHEAKFKFPPSRCLLEINPGLNMTADQLRDWAEQNRIGLVFDPRHFLSSTQAISLPKQPTRKPKGEWEKQFQTFAPHIEVVDINPPKKDDVTQLLAGRGILKELVQAAKETEGIQFLRVEIPMPISTQLPLSPRQQAGFNFLKEIGEALKSA